MGTGKTPLLQHMLRNRTWMTRRRLIRARRSFAARRVGAAWLAEDEKRCSCRTAASAAQGWLLEATAQGRTGRFDNLPARRLDGRVRRTRGGCGDGGVPVPAAAAGERRAKRWALWRAWTPASPSWTRLLLGGCSAAAAVESLAARATARRDMAPESEAVAPAEDDRGVAELLLDQQLNSPRT